MYFYHESYLETQYAEKILDDLRSADRLADVRDYEPIRIPAILNWLVIVTIALCVIVTIIQVLTGSAA